MEDYLTKIFSSTTPSYTNSYFLFHFRFERIFLGRCFSALLTVLLGYLLYSYTVERIKSKNTGNLVLGVYFLNGMILAWTPLNNYPALVNLFAFLSFYALYLSVKKKNSKILFFCGAFLSLATQMRVVFITLFPLYLYFIKKGKKDFRWLIYGFLVPLPITFYFFLKSPKAFLFDNFYYHFVKGPSRLSEIMLQKILVLIKVFVIPTNIILVWLVYLAFKYYKKRNWNVSLSFWLLAVEAYFLLFIIFPYPLHNLTITPKSSPF